jgi:hypothetical protein
MSKREVNDDFLGEGQFPLPVSDGSCVPLIPEGMIARGINHELPGGSLPNVWLLYAGAGVHSEV